MTQTSTDNAVYEPDERWIPVERRWLGVDRGTVAPALAVLGLAFVTSVALPVADELVQYEDEVAAGDMMELGDGVTFVPEPGWGIIAGVRAGRPAADGTYPPQATLVDGDVLFTVQADTFPGDANALLDQVATTPEVLGAGDLQFIGDRTSVTTDAGEPGVVVPIATADAAGVLAAFVLDGQGVTALAIQPPTVTPAETDAISQMVASIRHDSEDQA
ncbi:MULTISPECIES: hypothetical protein [Mycobacteriaceae]|uniref:hypothetical protein n=1 Tax=Mycobacteriaceae TaxID=1762 RepID=UPI0007FC63A3|nr:MULTISPECIES: hypothetical protein [Mycobacteriaceae]MCK0175403.1 hypothetical protein [Mycolicibacterium sp. F2034L]OBB60022.1 hypothetical protein A5757_12620 [Mycobacterium sp. 852013-51886_SCH5428379]